MISLYHRWIGMAVKAKAEPKTQTSQTSPYPGRPLAEAKALVDDPAAFTREMTKILLAKQSHPLIAQMMRPAGSGNPPPAHGTASGTSSHERPSVEKAPCTDLRSDPTLLRNSCRTTQADAYVNHAHQTQAQSVNSQN